jgi:hypothetical protein
LRELRHIGRMYLNNALGNFNLYPYVFWFYFTTFGTYRFNVFSKALL